MFTFDSTKLREFDLRKAREFVEFWVKGDSDHFYPLDIFVSF